MPSRPNLAVSSTSIAAHEPTMLYVVPQFKLQDSQPSKAQLQLRTWQQPRHHC